MTDILAGPIPAPGPDLILPQIHEPSPTRSERGGLDRSLVHGIAWTGGVKWGSQLLTWCSTLVVARVLSPEDYGLVGMAALFLGLVTLLNEFGIGIAIVTLRDLTSEQLKQLNTLAVLFGLASFAVGCAAAIPLSRFFGSPPLVAVVVAMSTTFIITSFRTVPMGVLQKELNFRSLALLEGAQAIILAIGTVVLALLGFGYWTLVIGNIASAIVSSAVVMVLYPQRYAIPRASSLAGAMRFSGHIISGRLAWFVYSNADFLTVGRMLGQSALGAYSIAWTIANIPIEKITAMVMRVTPAIFSAVQQEREELRRYFLLVTEGIALVTFPVTFGLAIVARDFVLVALGERWSVAIGPLQLLALYAAFRSLTPVFPQLLNVKGRSRYVMWNSFLLALLLPLGFLAGVRWGTTGVAIAWMVVHPLLIWPLLREVLRELDLSFGAYCRAATPAATGTVLMWLAIMAAASAVPPSWPRVAHLSLEVSAGALTYSAVVLLLHRKRIQSFREMLRSQV
jgi:O-antigen/teichoic acid export membrane protein